MKKLFAIIAILGSISLSSFAQSHSDRITFGVGLLYERGLDATLAGMSAKAVVMSVQNRSGRTTVHGVLALPTNPVFGAVVTTMGIYASVPVQEATRINSWVASMLATNIIMHLGTDGFCIGKLNVT